jgi:hypothetical protein
MTQGLADTTAVPMPIYWAVAGIIVLVVEHIFALVTPPYGLHVPLLFHLTFGSLYAWLAVMVHAGTGWALILLTALLATQSIGRVVVLPRRGSTLRPAAQSAAGRRLRCHTHHGAAAVAAAVLARLLLPLAASSSQAGRGEPAACLLEIELNLFRPGSPGSSGNKQT